MFIRIECANVIQIKSKEKQRNFSRNSQFVCEKKNPKKFHRFFLSIYCEWVHNNNNSESSYNSVVLLFVRLVFVTNDRYKTRPNEKQKNERKIQWNYSFNFKWLLSLKERTSFEPIKKNWKVRKKTHRQPYTYQANELNEKIKRKQGQKQIIM